MSNLLPSPDFFDPDVLHGFRSKISFVIHTPRKWKAREGGRGGKRMGVGVGERRGNTIAMTVF